MAIKNITKTEFQRLLKSIGNATFKIEFEEDVWYEQLTDNDEVYSHKLLSFKELKSYDALSTKAKEANKPVDKTGDAYVCVCDAAVYYYLVPVMKKQKEEARKTVFKYGTMRANMKSANPCVTSSKHEAA